jgi:hypothetical protein
MTISGVLCGPCPYCDMVPIVDDDCCNAARAASRVGQHVEEDLREAIRDALALLRAGDTASAIRRLEDTDA